MHNLFVSPRYAVDSCRKLVISHNIILIEIHSVSIITLLNADLIKELENERCNKTLRQIEKTEPETNWIRL